MAWSPATTASPSPARIRASPRIALLTKYASANRPGLTAEVDAEHTEFTFDLK